MPKGFTSIDEVLKTFSVDEQTEIEEGAHAMVLTYGLCKLDGCVASKIGTDLRKFEAKLFVRMPTGKEFEMPIPGAHV